MRGESKKRIAEVALALFSERGYDGTSMSDIAAELGITKAALYKHYAGKREIFESITKRMRTADFENADAHEMPTDTPQSGGAAYDGTTAEEIRAYSMAQFCYWTEEEFPSRFRKMLTVEQYHDPEMARLYRDYLAEGPLDYMAAIFRGTSASDADAMQKALAFYGPMFLLYSVYDGTEDKTYAKRLLADHIDRFFGTYEKQNENEK